MVLTSGLLAHRVAAMFNSSLTWAGFHIPTLSAWEYGRTQPGVILHYLRLTFWPWGLTLDTGWPLAMTVSSVLIPGLVVLALVILTAYGVARRSPWGFLGTWFFLVLAPTSTFLPIADLAVEHRMYLPLAAVTTGAVMGAYLLGEEIIKRRPSVRAERVRHGLAAALVAVAVLFVVLTLIRNHDYRSEVAFWTDNAARRPDHARVHYNLGAVLVESGNPAAGVEESSTAIALWPKYAAAYSNRGAGLAMLHRYDEALADLNKAIELRPEYASAYANRGNVYLDTGRYEEAVRDFTKAAIISPKLASAYRSRGVALFHLKQYDGALSDLDHAIELKRGYFDAYSSRGSVYLALGRLSDALADCDRAVELKPDSAQAFCNRAVVLSRMGQHERAILDYTSAIELDPKRPEFYNDRGVAFAMTGRRREAVQDYSRAIELNPGYSAALVNRATDYVHLGELDKARADLKAFQAQGGTPPPELLKAVNRQ
jgi:tetratricopeptide (TPR) repeat protein